jgi:hypothetical protein
MSTIRNPVGPQAPQVYWRRRLLVALIALAVIIIVVLIIVRPGSGSTPAGGASPGPSTSSGSPVKTNPSAACADTNLKLLAVTDKKTYAATEKPQISMKLTNTGTSACTVNLGSTKQELIITSGAEKIWDSKDCQTGAVDSAIVIKPGDANAVTTPAIAWSRTRSSTKTCASTTLAPVTAGGASYHLAVVLGTLKPATTAQFILN